MLSAPIAKPLSPAAIAQASLRRFSDDHLLFPKYSELTGRRRTPFDFEPIKRITVNVAPLSKEPAEATLSEVAIEHPSTPPVPVPDMEGLSLVGTVPGSRQSFALIEDKQNGEVLTLSRGSSLRNMIIREIHPHKIVLSLAGQTTELLLEPFDPDSSARLAEDRVTARPVQTFISTNNITPDEQPAEAQQALPLELSGYMLNTRDRQERGLERTGMLITSVSRNDIDVRILDVLLAIDGAGITSVEQVNALIGRAAGRATKTSINLALFRNGHSLSVPVNLP